MKRLMDFFVKAFLMGCCFIVPAFSVADNLESLFTSPPPEARPWTYWFWMNGTMTREGITADLEALSRAGVGGVLIMEVARPGAMVPPGPVAFAGPEWRELFKFAVAEAGRLGMQVNMNNDAGWCGSGGPWNKPENSMQQLTWTTTSVAGPRHYSAVLPLPRTVQPKAKAVARATKRAKAGQPTPKAKARAAKRAKAPAAPQPAPASAVPAPEPPALSYYKDLKVFAYPQKAAAIRPADLVDLTDKMDASGRLTWDAPEGAWTILRLGCKSTGKTNHPAPASGEGLECDKLDPGPMKLHFDNFLAKLIEDAGPAAGKVFTMTHIDSSEVGTQNWTPRLAEEFKARRGYDLAPWLPCLAGGPPAGDAEQARRFLWDFNRARAEMYVDYYAGALRRLANERGLKLSIEAYAPNGEFIDALKYAARADVPMGEFWVTRWGAWHLQSPRLIASAAHALGKPVVGAESFTARPDADPFTEHPYSIKTTGDWAYCEGINRFIFHRTVMNPWGEKLAPGMSFGGYGTHFDRMQTWWEPVAPALMKYFARCQALLQRGEFVADVARLVTVGEKYGIRPYMETLPAQYAPLPPGYNYDYLSDEVLLKDVRVENGRLVTPHMSWRVLQIPESPEMEPELLRKVAELARAGAKIIGPRPERSPSLRNYPRCDDEVRALAQDLWSTATSVPPVIPHPRALDAYLKEAAGGPDFTFAIDPPPTDEALMSITNGIGPRWSGEPQRLMPTAGLNWIHRRIDGAEVYFVANPQHRAVEALCTFRVRGLQPELWDPATGAIRRPAAFAFTAQGTRVPLHFDPAGSVFVVFRAKPDPTTQVTRVIHDGGSQIFGSGAVSPVRLPEMWIENGTVTLLPPDQARYDLVFADGHNQAFESPAQPAPQAIAGPWQVRFQSARGAPEQAVFTKLADWSKHENEGIRYFSGTASYTTAFEWAPSAAEHTRWRLDLGDVRVIAEVKLNGKGLGALWKPPFTVDAAGALKPGKNELEIKVTNTWPNRLIGDERFPDDCTPDGSWTAGSIKAWPEWLLKGQPRPEPRRITFTTWKYYAKDSPLLPAGLLGPVELHGENVIEILKR